MIGSIIQGAASVGSGISGLIGARKDKLAAENAANKSWERNYQAQKEFAQNSIQWRVQDAKKAGINPYAVVAGQSAGYTPQDTSYQTNYQGAASHAMNALGDAMGQLNMAMAAEDLKGKKLDNDKKAVELINEQLKSSMGQTSATLPAFPGQTAPVKKSTGMMVITSPRGEQYFVPGNEDADFSPAYISQLLDSMYDKRVYDEGAKLSKKHIPSLGLLGYRNIPSQELQNNIPGIKAAKIASDYGTAAGLLSLPYYHAQELWDKAAYRLQRALGLKKR